MTVTRPVTNVLHTASMPRNTTPLSITAKISTPIIVPKIVPAPPASGVPPMMTAAITGRRKSAPELGSTAPRKPTNSTPDRPRHAPISTSTWILVRPIGTPARRAASGLLPMARVR